MVKIEDALNLIDNYNYQRKINLKKVDDALNYVSSEDIYAEVNVPHFNKSAMDGYAIISSDLESFNKFRVVKTIYAGELNTITLKPGECVKIMTGAQICSNSDRVIIKELANTLDDDYVSFNIPKTDLKANISYIGEDILKDELLITKDTLLTPTILAVLKSSGLSEINVYHKPKILILTTGDEILQDNFNSDKPIIYNSNQTYLQTRLAELGFINIEILHVKDDIKDFKKILSKDFDLLISTGAISVGDKDIIRKFITTTPDVNIIFDKINIMPGGPVCFWEFENKPIISLAGSPFANLVTFELLVTRFLSNYTFNNKISFKKETRILKGEWTRDVKKTRFAKVKIDNTYANIITNNHNASTLFEMINCNGFLIIKPHQKLNNNSKVDVIILGGNNG